MNRLESPSPIGFTLFDKTGGEMELSGGLRGVLKGGLGWGSVG